MLRIAVDDQSGLSIEAHYQFIFEVCFVAGHDLPQRNHLSRDGAPDLKVANACDVSSLIGRCPHDDRQQLIFLSEQADTHTLEALAQRTGDVAALNSCEVCLALGDDGAQNFHSLAPVRAQGLGIAAFRKDGFRLGGEIAQDVGVGTAKARLNLSRAPRTELKLGAISEGIRELSANVSLDVADQTIDAGSVVHIDQKLRVGGVQLLGCVGEEKTKASFAQKRRDVGDAFSFEDVVLEPLRLALGFRNMGALGQPKIDHHLWASRRGEKAPFHEAEAPNRCTERDQDQADGEPAHSHAAV